MIRCASCGHESERVEDFARGKDRLRECPQCKSIDLKGLPGGIFPAQILLAQQRRAKDKT